MRVLYVVLSILLSPLAQAEALAVQRVTVIDATGTPPQPDMTVVVEQGRIAAIGPSKKLNIPAGAQVVDGKGKFLIPGFWDMHVHDYAYWPGGGGQTWSYPLYPGLLAFEKCGAQRTPTRGALCTPSTANHHRARTSPVRSSTVQDPQCPERSA
jgi:hypothetical protein